VQVEEGLAMATVAESVAPPSSRRSGRSWRRPRLSDTRAIGWGRAGGEDVVMVPADVGSVPPPLAWEHDAAMSTTPESSTAAGVASIEGVTDLSSSQYVDSPSIRTIDLDATELPSNDR
jgi:hypothetical protein